MWVILAAVLLSILFFHLCSFSDSTIWLLQQQYLLCCSPLWERTSHYPQEGFLRIKSRLLFLVYKSLQDLALSSRQANLSVPWHIKLVSSTWNALLSDLCTSDSFSSFISHFKFRSSGLPCSSNIKQLFDHFSPHLHLIITTLVMVWFVWHIVCA